MILDCMTVNNLYGNISPIHVLYMKLYTNIIRVTHAERITVNVNTYDDVHIIIQ
jgi:hypothetical protein